MRTLGPSAVRAARDNIMLAWRCSLPHEVALTQEEMPKGDKRQLIEEILELFIDAGVMAEFPAPKYLLAVQDQELIIVKRLADEESVLGSGVLRPQEPLRGHSTIYTKLNDAFLLQQLSSKISEKSKLLSMQVTDASMRPVLVDNGRKPGGARFFHVTVRGNGLELSKEWIFGGNLNFIKDLIPRWKPEYIEAVDLGIFPHAVDAK